jgi:hypothetical protein
MKPMPKYLTAKQLGITPAERKALIAERNLLASGKVPHNPSPIAGASSSVRRIFNMAHVELRAKCGTVCCIGGGMALRMKAFKEETDYYTKRARSKALALLFFPSICDWWEITPEQAVKAIDRFGTKGSFVDPWEGV